MGAALLFWGWEVDLPIAGAAMAALFESARWIKLRWELTEKDFTRIWTFCSLVLLAAVVLAFTANEGPADFRGFLQHPSFRTQRNAGLAGERTVANVMRWLPMIYYFFMGAQVLSSRQGVPLETISMILRWRWKRARKLGLPPPPSRTVDISYPFFATCLLAAGIHPSENSTYFWGLAALVTWALWPRRSRRFAPALWLAAVAAAVGLGYFGQRGIGNLNRYLGNYNPAWLLSYGRRGFDPARSRMMLGQIGQVQSSGAIVVRVQPQTSRAPPPLLREASYRTYKGQFWLSGSHESDFEIIASERNGSNDTSFVLLAPKTNSQVVSIACYLPGGKGLLPLPPGATRLDDLVNVEVKRNPLGAVLDSGPGLVVFESAYGPGPTADSTPTDADLDASTRSSKEGSALDAVLEELNLKSKTLDDALFVLRSFFQTKFAYALWDARNVVTRTNETPLSRFLIETRRGHCEYFATATVLLLRKAGFPARYAVGYAVNEASGSGYVVRQRDAHAWCLVWRNGAWEDFDTTPGGWVAAEAKRRSPFQFASDFFSRLWFEFAKFRWGQSQVRQYILWGLVPVLGALLYQIVSRVRRQRARRDEQPTSQAWPGLDSEFFQLERLLASRGFIRPSSEPLSVWLRRAADAPALGGLRPALEELLRLHYRYRFDPRGIEPVERQTLRDRARACFDQMAARQGR